MCLVSGVRARCVGKGAQLGCARKDVLVIACVQGCVDKDRVARACGQGCVGKHVPMCVCVCVRACKLMQ